MEEELLGAESWRESMGGWSRQMPQETIAKQTRKRPREGEEKGKAEGKSRGGTDGVDEAPICAQ